MKKFSLFLSAMLISMMSFAAEQTATLSFADKAQRTVFTTSQQVWEQNGLVLTNDKGGSTSNVADYAKPARFYKGSTLTLVCTLGNVKQVVFDCNNATYATSLGKSIGEGATVSDDKVTVVLDGTTDTYTIATLSDGQVRMDELTVTYEEAASNPDAVKYTVTANVNDPAMGTVSGAGEYEEGKTATLTAHANAGYEFVNWSNGSTDNPLKFEVTENVELTANFQAQTPITIAEALVLADGAACVLNPVTVVYVSGSYIYIEDESAYALAYKYNYGLVAGDKVTGLAITKSTYNGIAQFTPASAYADLTIAAGEAPAIDELTSAPTVADNHLVKLMNVKMEGEFTTSTSGTLVATCADETTINIYNNKVNAYTFVADKTYNIIGGVTQYKNVIQIQAYEIEEYVAPVTYYNIYLTAAPSEGGEVEGAGEYAENAEATLTATAAEGYEFVNWTVGDSIISTENPYSFVVTADVALVANFKEVEPAIEWIEMALEISNLTTMEMPVEGVTYLQLTGRDDMNDADVMLFLNNYTGEEKAYEVNAESSFMTFGGLELTVMDGSITKSVDPELGDVYAGIVHASVEEDGVAMYVAFDLKMYALPATVIELDGVEITVNEESAIAFFNATWEGSPLQVEVSGFEEVEFKEYPECWLSIGDDVNWVDAAAGPAAIIIEDGVAMLEGEFTSFSTGKTYEVMLSGKLPVKEEPVVEPVYEENKLNPFAFGLESVLSEDASLLTVTYRLNNSNATSVDVVVYNGEEVVATVPGTTTIGVNVVEVATANLPTGVELTWGVVVKGTSVEAPTQEEKMYSMYCPHGLAIDKDPESEYFGRILVADAMNLVKDKAGYLGSGIGAGLHAFNPSFTTDSTVYTGGNDFTRILASNGYQPWRVKISEDGRIFVSSLDLNGVVVWEVSKDLQTWTPVIAGTNDATDHNIYDADGNFVAGLNCSMDVVGSGENLKLLLYSTNNKGIAFNQSGYRLDEYALGTATTWTGTPKNILEGGKLGLVHTNVEFIYDGEGGYWFGASRAGNAGQPNLVHINAAGEQDYYTEDAGLYGGDGVLVHNGMLFKGKARTSSTVGNFGVWTIGKDADGKVTLTEKWSVAANGIGRNLNEFAVDYAENLYVVGNSGEKIIAYALPYSGEVTTPAASQYAFTVGSAVEPVEMVGVVKRALQLGEATIVLTHESDGAAHLYKVVDGVAVAELSQEGVVPVDPENKGSYLAISDIAVTEDGKLVANNYVRCQFAGTAPEAGYKLGTSYYYIWDDLTGAPRVWFTSQATARSSHGDMGKTFAVKGTSTDAKVLVTAVHNNNRAVRMALYSIIDGVYEEPDIAGGTYNNDYYFNFGLHTKANYYKEETQGKEFYLLASPLADASWIIEGELSEPSEFLVPAEIGADYAANQEIAAGTLGNKYQGTSIVTVGEQVLMVAPYATAEGLLAGVKVLDITAGLEAATEVATADLDAAVEATAAATAVAVAENTLTITLVADATLHTLEVVLEEKPDYMLIEDEITNLVIDLESMAIIGGPSTMWQVEVFLGLAEDDNMDGQWSLSPESSVAIMGFDARFIDGYVYDIDVNAPAAKAVLYVEDSGFFYEIKLNMTSTPQESIVVVVEDATVQIDTIPLFGDQVDYALKMTADWTYAEDGVTYPVLVEVPVYYPEATEPSEMTCTVTIGGMGDTDPWLGFGEGTLTITTVDGVVTAKGLVANPYTGVAFDVTVSGKLPVVEPEATWTVAGAPASIFGTEWDPSNTANDMVKQEDGTYKWEKTDLTLAASNIQFKVAKNHAWNEAYPSSNYDLAIAEAGIYTITITFNPATQEVVGTATKTGDAVVIPTIAIAGDMNGWNTTANEFVVSEDELTASLTLPLEAKDYGFKMIIAGGWTSDGATVTRENNTVVFTGANGDNSTLTADVAGDYTFTWTYATSTLVVTYPVASSVDNVQVNATAVKVIKNSQLIIIKNGKEYNVQGAILK